MYTRSAPDRYGYAGLLTTSETSRFMEKRKKKKKEENKKYNHFCNFIYSLRDGELESGTVSKCSTRLKRINVI